MKHSLNVSEKREASAKVTSFSCSCGVKGSYASVMQHIVESTQGESALEPSMRSLGFPQRIETPVPVDDDFGGGDTKAHYLPNEPKAPAIPAVLPDPDPTPVPLPPEPVVRIERPRSIAESFQDMLRIAYQAGAASAATGENFETWYQREVLR
jgi:hypothetical protein